MAEGCVIGVDLGGTKLLAGAVDQDGTVHHRTNRPARGLDQRELVEMVAHAVEGVRRSVGQDVDAVGFGIPCTFDARTGLAVQAVNLPLHEWPWTPATQRAGLERDALYLVRPDGHVGFARSEPDIEASNCRVW